MPAGRPVRKRTSGYASDIHACSVLRTAIRLDRSADGDKADRAIRCVDALIEALANLHADVEDRARAAG